MSPSTSWSKTDILATVHRYWGFSELRPLQEQAIRAGLERRDSLVVMPTGGGKSLCYQVPAELARRTDIVVSPLISLMKDQVDGLRESGYPAGALYSGMPLDTLRETEAQIAAGRYRLVFVAPERLLTPRFLQLIERLQVRAFAIDEAHCISHWGHDFRPEYRQLAELKIRFPQASVHAYTATATARVREDIAEQLRLQNPAVLVGTFDRPNLVYRIVPRVDAQTQVLQVLRRHPGDAAIVYCISRKDTEAMAEWLRANRLRAAFYHAGMEADERRRTQDAFASEEIDVVAATVAFGMGIDRSNVRCVIHAAMPKSIEHYQQETGRAGRDGLEAECVMLYSAADVLRWESLIEKSAADASAPRRGDRRGPRPARTHAPILHRGSLPAPQAVRILRAGVSPRLTARRAISVSTKWKASLMRPSPRRRSSRAWRAPASASAPSILSTCCWAPIPNAFAAGATRSLVPTV